jgi:hypothetical protein
VPPEGHPKPVTRWQPKACPFCGDQEFVVLETDFGDVFRAHGIYAVCRKGHRTMTHPYERSDPAGRATAEQAAMNDWDKREPPALSDWQKADMAAKAGYYK